MNIRLFLPLISAIYISNVIGEVYVTHEWDPLKIVVVGGVIKHGIFDRALKNKVVYRKQLKNEIKNVIKVLKNRNHSQILLY